MKKAIRIVSTTMGAGALLAFASCSSTSANQDYATYPTSGYGDYGADTTDTNNAGGYGATEQNYATTTGAGAGGAYPTSPTDYGTDYGNTGGGAAAPTTSGSSQTHTVQRGETLYRISKNYGTTVANIKAANGLNSDLIRPGDVLTVR